MSTASPRLLVTAATGQLGRLVVQTLLETVPADRIVATVRDLAKASDLAALGVSVRQADYAKPATLAAAFAGVGRLLLVSGTDLGGRVAQHRNVIEAARAAGVGLVAYTSILRADTIPLRMLADEHHQTETLLADSGVPFVLLRNGWYTENQTVFVPSALARGAVLGSARDGRFSSAARADYAAAAAAVLVGEGHAGRTYELAGDAAYTLAEFAAEIAGQSGKPVGYKDLPAAEFEAALASAGLPPVLAHMVAASDTAAASGALFDDGGQLSRLIGRPTTPLSASVAAALEGSAGVADHLQKAHS